MNHHPSALPRVLLIAAIATLVASQMKASTRRASELERRGAV